MVTILIGKSASGKDTLLHELKEKHGFGDIVTTTSRPIREGEEEGVQYNFVSREQFMEKINNNELLEYRTYNTLVNGKADTWYYGCPKSAADKLDPNKDYVAIFDVQGAKDFVNYYGKDNCFVCYIDVNDTIRQRRAMNRGSFDQTEWTRRVIDDRKKFDWNNMKGLVNCVMANNTESLEFLTNRFLDKYSKYQKHINLEKEENNDIER